MDPCIYRGALFRKSRSYELQLTAASRRTGIGRFLIDSLVRIGKKYRMCCIKLTALKGMLAIHLILSTDLCVVINDVPVNVAAMGFYSAMEWVPPHPVVSRYL